jgi:hypothetical protein
MQIYLPELHQVIQDDDAEEARPDTPGPLPAGGRQPGKTRPIPASCWPCASWKSRHVHESGASIGADGSAFLRVVAELERTNESSFVARDDQVDP